MDARGIHSDRFLSGSAWMLQGLDTIPNQSYDMIMIIKEKPYAAQHKRCNIIISFGPTRMLGEPHAVQTHTPLPQQNRIPIVVDAATL